MTARLSNSLYNLAGGIDEMVDRSESVGAAVLAAIAERVLD
jgi:hypothetical protein